MTKEEEILRYNKVDQNLEALIELHKLISENNKLNNHLIYYDSNFPSYFKNIVADSESDYIYILKLKGTLEGFIHFKTFNNIIFLNNICLSENYQGKGFGKIFLFESLALLNSEEYKYFALDVFMSNKLAFLWYKNLGLEKTKSTIWQQLSPLNRQNSNKLCNGILFKNDLNGFNSLFFKDHKIATIINNSTMLLHDLSFINKIPLDSYILITNQDTQLLEGVNFELTDLETSIRLEGQLTMVLNKLKKINASNN